MQRIVAHLDMDAFYAAVEERDNPQFAGFAIVVGADPKNGMGRGVVSTANYQARKYGIHSAMPISTAWRFSQDALKKGEPKTVFLPVNMSYYAKASEKIMTIICSHVPIVEQTSIDEAYLDLSFCSSFEKAKELIEKIKKEIKGNESLTATVGIGPNKLIAKLASARYKPDGLTLVTSKEVESFMDELSLRDIPGIGPKTAEKLSSHKVFTMRDLRKVSESQLIAWFGKWGSEMYRKVRGIDDSPISTEHEVKSVSEQETYVEDSLSAAFLIERVYKLAGRVIERMKNENVSAFKTVTIMVRFSDFETKSRAHSLKDFTDNISILQKETLKLFLPFLDKRENPQLKKIRLLGVGVENFPDSHPRQNQHEKRIEPLQSELF